jgi:hypothetical protein
MKMLWLPVMLLTALTSAQTVSLSGTVTNGSGQPLQGAVVTLINARLSDTTDANGSYSFTSGLAARSVAIRDRAVDNAIRFRKNAVVVDAPSSAIISMKLYTTRGALVSTIYNGRVSQGKTSVPFSLSKYGRNAFLLTVDVGESSTTSTIVSTANGYAISSISRTQTPGALAKTAAISDWLQAVKPCYTSHLEQISSYSGAKNFSMAASSATPDFGPNTHIFDPSTPNMQSQLTSIYSQQEGAQFGNGRHAFLFKPGSYTLSIMVGYYEEIIGLGLTPDSVRITGAVQSDAALPGGNATCNFWRSFSGVAVTPTGGSDKWATSQACPVRRVHIKGNLNLTEGCSTCWASGGFLADSKVDGAVNPNVEQQWISRNCEWGSWGPNSGSWNFAFVGCTNLPTDGTWPNQPYTFIPKTPVIAEKPYLVYDNCGYSVMVPDLRRDSTLGTSWSSGKPAGTMLPIDLFYIAKSASDNATTMNAALSQGKNLLLTPGIYHLSQALQVTRPGTVVLGIGIPSLVPDNGTPAMKVADVDGVKIGGILFEANSTNSPTLLQVGDSGATVDHSKNPTCLYDIYCRPGGAFAGQTSCMVTINSNNVIFDHNWLWRADHGSGVGWNSNKNATGLIVNGNNVTCYGLLVEHTQKYQTMWNGNGGRMYMYQSELPYDPPDQASWMNGNVNGYASYKVASNVTTHEAQGIGIYCAFQNGSVKEFSAIEAPSAPGIKMVHLLTLHLNGNEITHVINDIGSAASGASRVARVNQFP